MSKDIKVAHPTDVKYENDLLVPEEPEEDEETSSVAYGAESYSPFNRTFSEDSHKSVSFSSLVTAIRVAKWMARAYGYTPECKSLFTSQDKVIE